MEEPVPEELQHRRLGAVSWGLLYLVAYGAATILYGILTGFRPQFLLRLHLNDSGLNMVAAWYVLAAGGAFFWYGWSGAGKAPLKRLQKIMAVFPVPAAGAGVWIWSYTSLGGRDSDMQGISWLLYNVYIYWLQPALEVWRFYVEDPDLIKGIGLAGSLVPALLTYAGIRTRLWRDGAVRGRRLLTGAAVLTGILAILLGVAAISRGASDYTRGTYPRIDGATAALPFGQLLANRLVGMSKPEAERFVRFNTTHNAYVNLIENKADLIFAAGPSDEEIRLAEARQVRFQLTPIGKDAFVFLVHRNNPVSSLTVTQIQDIYTGKTKNWFEVGGTDGEIIAFQREPNSGSQTFMEKKVMQGLTMADPPTVRKPGGMGGLIDAVADYRNSAQAFGYSFYYYASRMHKREDVRFLAINGVEPSQDRIRDGTYPYTAVLYAVTREGEPRDSPAGRLVEWLKTEAGRKAVEDGGYVPVQASER